MVKSTNGPCVGAPAAQCLTLWHTVHAGRTRSREEEAVSSDDSNGSKRQKRSRMERVVSMGTVLQCVETHTDRQDNLDDAVGEIPATVHEMTEGKAWSFALVRPMIPNHWATLFSPPHKTTGVDPHSPH